VHQNRGLGLFSVVVDGCFLGDGQLAEKDAQTYDEGPHIGDFLLD